MSAAIKIEISDEATGDDVHRFRNFGEDIYRELRDTCSLNVDEIDQSTTTFVVRDIHKRDLGVVIEAIKRELRRHQFDQTATLTRV